MTDVLDHSPLATPLTATKPYTPERRRRRGDDTGTSGEAPRFRPDVEGLRAIAVLSVVLYHADLGIRGGFVGVDVFFVISGYLITRQLLSTVGTRGIQALPQFYARRIKRLLPAATVVVIATMFAARLWAPPLQVRSIATDALYTTFYGLNYRLAIQGTQYQHHTNSVSPMQHFWSLGVEEQFYVVWPVLILLCFYLGRRFSKPLLTVALTGLVALSFWFSITVTAQSASWAYFSLHTRAWELGVGALVAVAAGRLANKPRWLDEWGGGIGLLAIIVSAFLYSDATAYPGSAAALPVVGTAFVIACGCAEQPRGIERFLGEPLMQCLGRISYGWYLWHWPMIILAPQILGHPLEWRGRLILVSISLAVALISFFLIEEPFRNRGRRLWHGFATGLGFSGAVAGAFCLVLAFSPPLVGGGAAVTLAEASEATPAAMRVFEADIAKGIATEAAPSNLTPALEAAADDLPPSSANGCQADFLSMKQGTCVYGDPNGTRTVVLFGDSHVEQWLPAFDASGKKAHWKVVNWTKAACPPAQLTVDAPTLGRIYTECDTWRGQTMSRIANLKPDMVIVSQSENVASRSVAPADFASATVATLDALKNSTGAKIEYISDIPLPNYDMPACVADHLGDVRECTFGVDEAYIFPERHEALGPAIAEAGFRVIDTEKWMCTDNTCAAVVGNLLVYRNDTHITAAYSHWLAPMIAPLLTTK